MATPVTAEDDLSLDLPEMKSSPSSPEKRNETLCGSEPWENEEAHGWVLATASRGGMIIYAGLFGTVAINAFGVSQSNCKGEVFNGSILASSLLATLVFVEGILNAVLSPFMGSFADLTTHRKAGLGWSFVCLCLILAAESLLFLSESSGVLDPRREFETDQVFLQQPLFNSDAGLVLLLVVFAMQASTYEFNALMATTYIPELSKIPAEVTVYVSKGYTYFHFMQISLAVLVTVAGLAGLNSFQLGSLGSGIALIFAIVLFRPAYKRLGERKTVPEGLNSAYCGLLHVKKTFTDGLRDYSQLRMFLYSYAFAAAGLSSVVTLATSYLNFALGFSGTTTSLLLSVALVMTVPGAFLSRKLIARVGFRNAYLLITMFFGATFIVGPLVLGSTLQPITKDESFDNSTGVVFGQCNTNDITPEEIEDINSLNKETSTIGLVLTALIVCTWGLALGATPVVVNAWFAVLIPAGNESTMFGMRVTVAKSLSFFPPLFFALINENQENGIEYAIMTLAPFFFVGAAIAYFVDTEKGIEEVERTMHMRRGDTSLVVDANRLSSLSAQL